MGGSVGFVSTGWRSQETQEGLTYQPHLSEESLSHSEGLGEGEVASYHFEEGAISS